MQVSQHITETPVPDMYGETLHLLMHSLVTQLGMELMPGELFSETPESTEDAENITLLCVRTGTMHPVPKIWLEPIVTARQIEPIIRDAVAGQRKNLRDQFAIGALEWLKIPGMMHVFGDGHFEIVMDRAQVAREAYRLADVMLTVREEEVPA